MDVTTQRPVRRTYGKPKNIDADVPERVPPTVAVEEEEEATQSSANLVSDGTPEDKTVASSPLDEAGAALPRNGSPPVVWDGLKKGAGADWRKMMADDSDSGNEDEDPLEGAGETDDILARARKAVLARDPEEPESSSLSPLTSTDPLALSPADPERERERSATPEEETYAIKPRKRTIKASSDHSSSSDGEPNNAASTPRNRNARTPTTLRRGTPDMDVALPSSQPEYQRLLDKAHEKSERRRARRTVATSDAEPEPEAEKEDEAGDGGLQTSPTSPSLRRAVDPKRRRRKVVAASEDEEEDTPRRTLPTRTEHARPRIATSPGMDSDDSEGEMDGFKKTMGRILDRRPAEVVEETSEPPPASPEQEVTARTRRRGKKVQEDGSDDSEDEHEGRRKPRLRVSVLWVS